MDTESPPINHAEVARLRRQAAQRKYRKRVRKVRLLWVIATALFIVLLVEMLVALCCSPRFWVYQITVNPSETLQKSEVIRLMDLSAFSNYYRISLGKLARNIEREPRVATAEVKRGAIGMLTVTVHERQAVCQIGAMTPPLYMDANGILFQRPGPLPSPVPVIDGVSIPFSKDMLGKHATFEQCNDVLLCLKEFRANTESGSLDITHLALVPDSTRTGYSLMLVLHQGTMIYLGRPDCLHEKSICIQQTILKASEKGYTLEKLKYINVDFIDEKAREKGILAIICPKRNNQEETVIR